MNDRHNKSAMLSIAAFLLILFCSAAYAQNQNPAEGGSYAGIDSCAVCHEEIAKAYRKSPHWASAKMKLPSDERKGCEACHGPGQKHADDPSQPIFSFRKEEPRDRSAHCLSCHGTRKGSSFRQSVHERNNISCDMCHSSGHGSARQAGLKLLQQPENLLCGSCHGEQSAQFQMPFRHRTTDGVLLCRDCHDAHGRSVRVVGKIRRDQPCFRCHSEKQGPFTFEHLASTVTGCATCHQPHGSTNPRLLTRNEVRFLCLECHADTSRFHDLSNSRFYNCTVCHSAIHGSYVDSNFLR